MSILEVLRVARMVIGWTIQLLPDDELRSHLSGTARMLDDRIADVAEDLKFGGS